jgi:outer membrane protein assembly factor BamB
MRKSLLLLCGLGLFTLTAAADDWPQWRGPKRDGMSAETGLLKEWPKQGPRLLWQLKDIGSGYSTPAVVGARLYVQSNTGMESEFVQALDIKSGAHLWSAKLGKVGANQGPQYPGARSTPTVDGELLFALGSDGDLACLEAATGKVRWQKNLRTAFNGVPGKWAYAESPLIDGDTLVCTPGGKDATLVALNKNSGEVIWICAVPGGDEAAYASIITMQVGGNKEYVQFLQNGLVGVDAKSGKFLWRYDKTSKSPANIPTPLAHDGYVYSASGLGGCGLIKLEPKQGDVKVDEVYYTKKLPNAIGGSVLIDGYMYGTSRNGLMCVEFKNGNIKWEDKSVGAGSVLYADGRLYLHGEDNDEVALVEATPEAYRERGRFSLPDQPQRLAKGKAQPKAWAYPVVANGRLYLRDQGALWCYDVQAKR